MPSKADIWMPLYIGDYLSATTHLSAEESGAYLHLLMHQWKNASLPAEEEALRRIARVEKDAWSIVWASLRHFFSIEQAGPKQERLERIRQEWQAKKDSASVKAAGAAKKRWDDAKRDAPSIAQALPQSCPSSSPSPSIKEIPAMPVEPIFAYYCQKMGRDPKKYTLTPARKKQAIARMKERGESAEADCRQAIDNLAASDWNMQNGYFDWSDQIFRSQEEFERRLAWVSPKSVTVAMPKPKIIYSDQEEDYAHA